jgi:hypothetical protein
MPQEGDFHRAGPNRATWPSVLNENPYQRPALGPVPIFSSAKCQSGVTKGQDIDLGEVSAVALLVVDA